MSKVTIIDQDNTRWRIGLLRYALAVNNRALVLYTAGAMLVGGIFTLWLMSAWLLALGGV